MNPLNLIPSAYFGIAKAAIFVSVPLAIFYAGWHYSHKYYAAAFLAKEQAAQLAYDAQLSKVIDTANAKIATQNAQTNEARNRYDTLKQNNQVAATTANRQLDGLRNENTRLLTAATHPATTAARCGTYATTASEVLGQCAARLVEMATDADGCAVKLRAAQDYINIHVSSNN